MYGDTHDDIVLDDELKAELKAEPKVLEAAKLGHRRNSGAVMLRAVLILQALYRGARKRQQVAYLRKHTRRMPDRVFVIILGALFYMKLLLALTLFWMQLTWALDQPNLLINRAEVVRRALAADVDLSVCTELVGLDKALGYSAYLMDEISLRRSIGALNIAQFPQLDMNGDGIINMTDFVTDNMVPEGTVRQFVQTRFHQEMSEEEWRHAKFVLGANQEDDNLTPLEFDQFVRRIFFSPSNDLWIMNENTCPVVDPTGTIQMVCPNSGGCRGRRCGRANEDCGRIETTGFQGHQHSLGNLYTLLIGGHAALAFVVSWVCWLPLTVPRGSALHVQYGRGYVLLMMLQLFMGITGGSVLLLSRGVWAANYIGYNSTGFPLVLYLEFAFLGSCMIDFLFTGLTSVHWKVYVPTKWWAPLRALSWFFFLVTCYWGFSLMLYGLYGLWDIWTMTERAAARLSDSITYCVLFVVHCPAYLAFVANAYAYWIRPMAFEKRIVHNGHGSYLGIFFFGGVRDVELLDYRLAEWSMHHGRCMRFVAALTTITLLANIGYRINAVLTPIMWVTVQFLHVAVYVREMYLLSKRRKLLRRGDAVNIEKVGRKVGDTMAQDATASAPLFGRSLAATSDEQERAKKRETQEEDDLAIQRLRGRPDTLYERPSLLPQDTETSQGGQDREGGVQLAEV